MNEIKTLPKDHKKAREQIAMRRKGNTQRRIERIKERSLLDRLNDSFSDIWGEL